MLTKVCNNFPVCRKQRLNLSLAGTPGLSIILNGKPTTMSYEQLVNLLKNTPASRVEKAEVMYSAPPQYHVRGAAINLILKGYRTGESGLKGEVKAGYLHDYQEWCTGWSQPVIYPSEMEYRPSV